MKVPEITGLAWDSGDKGGNGSPRGVVAKGSRVALVLLAPAGRAHLLEAGLHLLQHARRVTHHQLHRALGCLQQLHCLLVLLTLNALQGSAQTPGPGAYHPPPAPTLEMGPTVGGPGASPRGQGLVASGESNYFWLSVQPQNLVKSGTSPICPPSLSQNSRSIFIPLHPQSLLIPALSLLLFPSSLPPPPWPQLRPPPLPGRLLPSLLPRTFWPLVSTFNLSPVESQRDPSTPPS